MELEAHARCLGQGQPKGGGTLSGLETRQLDDPGKAGEDELDGDVDLPEGNVEWIRP